MWIDPFWAGLLLGIAIGVVLLVGLGAYLSARSRKGR